MKLVFRQYLASLRERGELDAILPDLLSELGYTVLSHPTIGTRQHGVDVMASSKADDGSTVLHLFSIKSGDLSRPEWDGTPQALRSSLNEILDVFIPMKVPPEFAQARIVICLCFGGEVHESVRENVSQFQKKHQTDRVSFVEWNGDHLAGLLVEGVLQEQLVEDALQTHFRKSIAMIDEPEIAFRHFSMLIRELCKQPASNTRKRATAIRQIHICLWVFFAWARDAGNLEGPCRASELAILQTWPLIRHDVGKSSKTAVDLCSCFTHLVDLHFAVWDSLYKDKILPHANIKHGLSVAVHARTPVEINFRMFETLGRVALRGLWMLWGRQKDRHVPEIRENWELDEADELAGQIIQLIDNNPVLLAPITDPQSVEIGLALLFLTMGRKWHPGARSYVGLLANRLSWAYKYHGPYPVGPCEYRDLIDHPKERKESYRKEQTAGSSIIPLIALWSTALSLPKSAVELSLVTKECLEHCNMHLWLPSDDSEDHLYTNDEMHGAALNEIPISDEGTEAFAILEKECAPDTQFFNLSAVKHAHWPIVALACRHYRLPLPPHLWIEILRQVRDEASESGL